MFTNDYVMRMIELFVRAVAKILHLRESGEKEEAYILLQDTIQGALGVNADTVDALDYDGFLSVMGAGGDMSPERFALLSELMRIKAEFAREEGRESVAVDCYDKALCLLLAALAEEPALEKLPQYAQRLERLQAALQGYRLSCHAYRALARWHEDAGRFGQAEDAHYRCMEAARHEEASVRDTLAFYDRLLALPPEALTQGNLPLEEVVAGRAELANHSLPQPALPAAL
jgi:tetratricopeptide (TPR) repeat protein